MKKVSSIFSAFVITVTMLSLSSCGPSACDCVEIMESWIVLNPNAEYTPEESGECVREYYTSGTLGTDEAKNNAIRNAKAKCNN